MKPKYILKLKPDELNYNEISANDYQFEIDYILDCSSYEYLSHEEKVDISGYLSDNNLQYIYVNHNMYKKDTIYKNLGVNGFISIIDIYDGDYDADDNEPVYNYIFQDASINSIIDDKYVTRIKTYEYILIIESSDYAILHNIDPDIDTSNVHIYNINITFKHIYDTYLYRPVKIYNNQEIVLTTI